MADAKKPDAKKGGDKKPAPAEGPSPYTPIFWIIGILVVLFAFVPSAVQWLGIGGEESLFDPEFVTGLKVLGISLISSLQAISAFVSLLFIIGIMYAKFRTGQVKREMNLKTKVKEVTEKKAQIAEETENKKWKRVVEHVNSPNPSDWRLSILEADILLGEVLEKAGYKGESIGEKLKAVERSDFATIDQAWEAHKVRNLIAHEGSSHPLNHGEAKRVISLFEEVFREFYYI